MLPIAEKAGFPALDGLFQRVEITIGWVWIALVALHLWRETRKATPEESPAHIPEISANAG